MPGATIDPESSVPKCSQLLARALALNPGDLGHVIVRLRTAELGRPMGVERCHIPAQVAPGTKMV